MRPVFGKFFCVTMGLCCLWNQCCNCWVLAAVALVAIYYLFLRSPRSRIPPSLPAVSSKRTWPRGTGAVINCVSPSTGQELGKCNAYTPAEVFAAEKRAREAQKKWSQVSWDERRAVLQDVLDWIVDNQETIIQWSVEDSGKTVTEASMGEVLITCEKIRWTICHAENILKREYRPLAFLLAFTKLAYVEYLPLGVLGIIVPWNYPFQNVVAHVITALICGNGCLVKVSEHASWSAEKIETVFRDILARRGHSPELVQVITGFGETGNALVESPVDKILFIGSPAIGKLVMKTASASLKPVILELGGKDPFIVCEDADWEHMLDIAIRGAFINLGQNCISAERFFVQEKVYDKFVTDIKKKVEALAQGASSLDESSPRCDFGAITMKSQIAIVENLLADAVSKGARIILGGKKKEGEKGCFFPPTILADVTQDMKIAKEEAFGPVMTIIKYKTEEQVIEWANSVPYGLGSSVFTTDYARAERISLALDTGMTNVNDFGMVPMVQVLPFGGVKDSGFGCFNGYEGLRGFCRVHSVVTDRFPSRTVTPKFLQYPLPKNAYKIVGAAVRMIYGRNLVTSVQALVDLVKNIIKG